MAFYKGETGALAIGVGTNGARDAMTALTKGNLFIPLENTNNANGTKNFLQNNSIFEVGGTAKITKAEDFPLNQVYIVKETNITGAEAGKIKGIKTKMDESNPNKPISTANIRNWTFNLNREAYETTSVGQDFRNYTPGMLTGDGTIDILNSDDSNYQKFVTNMGSDTAAGDVLLVLTINASERDDESPGYTGDTYFAFRAFLTVGGFSATVGEISAVTFNFNTNGPVALSFPAPA